MSTTIDAGSSQSPKKRKGVADETGTSKKKRKHTQPEEEPVHSQEEPTRKDKKDKKEKKGKKENAKTPAEDAVTLSQPTIIEDIELPDAPAENDMAGHELEAEEEEDVEEQEPVVADETQPEIVTDIDESILSSAAPSSFYSKRLSLYVPIPAVSLTSSTASILSLHLAPLLLTYFPPVEGIVLAFSDPLLSAKSDYGVNLPLQRPSSAEISRSPSGETFARCGDEYGVCWVWLTATFLVFKPQSGDELKGWTNVSSEGFVGLVSYNYFQTAVGKNRIPKSWRWDGPTRESTKSKKTRKGRLRDEEAIINGDEETYDSQEIALEDTTIDGGSNAFLDANGNKVAATQTFRVVDVEMVPGHEKDKWTLQIDGSLLSAEEEAAIMAEERQRFEAQRHRSRSRTPGVDNGSMPLMSGAALWSREGSAM